MDGTANTWRRQVRGVNRLNMRTTKWKRNPAWVHFNGESCWGVPQQPGKCEPLITTIQNESSYIIRRQTSRNAHQQQPLKPSLPPGTHDVLCTTTLSSIFSSSHEYRPSQDCNVFFQIRSDNNNTKGIAISFWLVLFVCWIDWVWWENRTTTYLPFLSPLSSALVGCYPIFSNVSKYPDTPKSHGAARVMLPVGRIDSTTRILHRIRWNGWWVVCSRR